jgi:hypothetical protein
MLVFMSSPGDGRWSVLFAALTAFAASLLSFGVAVGWPGIGFSTGMSEGMVALTGVVDWGSFWGVVVEGVCAGGVDWEFVGEFGWELVGVWEYAATESARKAVRPRCVTERMWGLLVGRFPAERTQLDVS